MPASIVSVNKTGDRSASFHVTAAAGDTLTLNALAAAIPGSSTLKDTLAESSASQTLSWVATEGLSIAAFGTASGPAFAAGTLTLTGNCVIRISLAHSISA
jgi:hypothetical protein